MKFDSRTKPPSSRLSTDSTPLLHAHLSSQSKQKNRSAHGRARPWQAKGYPRPIIGREVRLGPRVSPHRRERAIAARDCWSAAHKGVATVTSQEGEGDNDDALASPRLRDEPPRRRYYRSFNDRSRIECAHPLLLPLVHTSFNYIEGGGHLFPSWLRGIRFHSEWFWDIRFANFPRGSFIFFCHVS